MDNSAQIQREKLAQLERDRLAKLAQEQLRQQQIRLKNVYDQTLAREVGRIWDNQFIAAYANTDNQRVKIQITVARDGRVLNKKIIQRSASAELNRAANTFMAQLNKLPPFPKEMKVNKITQTLSLSAR